MNTVQGRSLNMAERDRALSMPWTDSVGCDRTDYLGPECLPDMILQTYLDDPKMTQFDRLVSVIRANAGRRIFGIWFVNGITDLWQYDEPCWFRTRRYSATTHQTADNLLVRPMSPVT